MKKRVLSLLLVLTMLFGLAVTGYAAEGDPDAGAPKLEITSDILGMANTNNKSTLKNEAIYLGAAAGPGDQAIYYYDENGDIQSSTEDGFTLKGDTVTYTGSAVISLEGKAIDASGATIELQDSNTTHANEMILDRSKVSLTTEDGKAVLTLSEGALEWNNWGYYDGEENPDLNSGREWSMMGGDGAGLYEFIFKISGLTSEGETLEDAYVRAYVWIYGRSSADLALSVQFVENTDGGYTPEVAQTTEAQWDWHTDGAESTAAKQPFMNDKATDYFTLTWPEGTDASGVTADDVTVTLRSRFGDAYVLSTETAYGEHEYAVRATAGQTVVAVTYQQWAYIPVYNTLEVSVKCGEETVSNTWNISSVGVYGVQTGGGGRTVENTVVVQNYHGLSGLTLANAANTKYTLTTKIDGTTYFYVEDADGNGSLGEGTVTGSGWFQTVTPPEGAYEGDATELYHVAVNGNCLFYETPATAKTEVKTVNGEEVEFTVNFSAVRSTAQMLAGGAQLEPGYNTYSTGADKWAWTYRYQAGWTPTTVTKEPTTVPYVNYPYGFAAGTPEDERPYADLTVSGPGGPGGPGGDIGGPGGDIGGPGGDTETNGVAGTYTYGDWTLTLNGDGTYTVTNGTTTVSGTYTHSEVYGGWGPFKSWTVSIILDEEGKAQLGELLPWYGTIKLGVSKESTAEKPVLDGTFSISLDVSKGLISNFEDYTIVTVANPDSPTGYTTTITVKDNGYNSVYAYGDWEAVWADQEPAANGISYDVTYSPDEWENGMNYASSSVLPLTQNENGDWSITLNLASSVMGVVCYHDIALEDLHDLFPQKTSFYVPWDAEKQSDSFDWSMAFPNEDAAGTVSDDVTDDGLKLSVYLPAGYDPNDTETKYPVLYLIPGGGSNYMSWFNDGMINNIFDNAIANGDVLPTIVVSMEREPVTTANDPDLENIEKIVAYIEANYNTYDDAAHRALGGVSMGSVAATDIWLAHPDLFGYWIFLSGADKQVFSAGEGDYTSIVEQLKTGNYYTGGGTIDFNMHAGDGSSASVDELNAWLEKYGVAYETGIAVGVHNWPIWTQLMISYVPDLLWAEYEEQTDPGITDPGTAEPDPEAPQTGDSMPLVLLSVVCLLAMTGCGITAVEIRKNRR